MKIESNCYSGIFVSTFSCIIHEKKKTNLHNWLNKPKEYSEVNSKDIYDDGEGTCFYLFIVFNFLGQWCLKVIRKRLPKHSFHWCGNASKGPTLAHSIVKKKKRKKKEKKDFRRVVTVVPS